jgi:hypothetical protein
MRARIILTLKQHRFETIAITILCLGLAIACVYEAYRLFALHTPAQCLSAMTGINTGPVFMTGTVGAPAVDPCQIPMDQRYRVLNSIDMNLARTLLVFAPFITGIIFGAPLVAREIEQGTAPLSWSLTGSRWRWLLARIGAVTLLIVPLLLAIALATDFLESALMPTLNPYASFDTYLLRGFILVFWGFAAFLGSVALGTILGRTAPAIFVALVVCGFVRVAWEPLMLRDVLTPAGQVLVDLKTFDPRNGYFYDPANLTFTFREVQGGRVITEDEAQAWYNAHQPTFDANGNMVGEPPDYTGQPMQVPYGLPGSMYWPVVAFESAILLAGALFCGGLALVWVERRRPY